VLTIGGMRFARGPLTLGQRIVAESLSQRTAEADYTYNIDRVVPVPVGVNVDKVCAAVYALACRHEALRTRFPAGGQEQVVDGAGSLAIRMCDSVEEARGVLMAEPFDIAAEWGMRVAVVCRKERPRSVVMCLSHLAVDAWAANLVAEDLRALLRGAEPPAPVQQPLEQAAAESTPDSRRQQADALAHVRTLLLTAPPEGPDAKADPAGWRLGVLRSCAVDPAARAVATRCRTTAAVVYLAAVAVGLGAGPHVLKTITHNRLTPAEMGCVAPFALDMFVPVDGSGETFDAVVAHTWAAYREAARHSRYDPAAIRPLVAAVAEERGSRPDLSVLVNDLRAAARPPAGTSPSTFRWHEPFRLPGLTRYLAIADDGDAVTLSLLANGVALPGERVPAFLHGMERLIVTAADGDTVLERVLDGAVHE
jgi:condensation domain-containing protein